MEFKDYLPITKQGTTTTPYHIDSMNEKKSLIDKSVFLGYIGNLVFMYYSESFLDKEAGFYAGNDNDIHIGIIKIFSIRIKVCLEEEQDEKVQSHFDNKQTSSSINLISKSA